MSLPFCPRRGRGKLPRSAERNSLLDFKRKTSRPLGANTLTQFEYPAQPVLKKGCRLERANTPAAVRVPRRAVQEKGEDAKSNGETAANFVYCYKIAQNRSVLLEMTGAKC